MSVGPVSIHIIVCVRMKAYIPIPKPSFALWSNPKKTPMNNI